MIMRKKIREGENKQRNEKRVEEGDSQVEEEGGRWRDDWGNNCKMKALTEVKIRRKNEVRRR